MQYGRGSSKLGAVEVCVGIHGREALREGRSPSEWVMDERRA